MAFQRCSSGGGSMPELNNIQTWLRLGGVTGSYATMQDILADTTALNKLMTSGGAVNYLVGCDDFITEICASSNGMNAIGASNYCANSLLSHNNWLDGIANSTYMESVLNVKVPTMTSNTTPSGECFASTIYPADYYHKYFAFDGDTSTSWYPASMESLTGQYVGYKFTNIVKSYLFEFLGHNATFASVIKFQGSQDGTTYVDLTENINIAISSVSSIIKQLFTKNIGNYQYYRFYFISGKANDGGGGLYCNELQFYGRADV